MTPSLNNSLQIILPDLHPELVPAGAARHIVGFARLLPPIHCAGFECRLDGNTFQVDFQQRILANQSEPKRLSDHITRSGWTSVSQWAHIDTLCSRLNNPSSVLYGRVSEFWMEFDIDEPPPDIPIPSVFLSLKQPRQKIFSEKSFLEISLKALEILQGGPVSARLASRLRTCAKACPEGAAIIDIGTLLARNTEIIRANVGGLPPGQIKSFLEKISWRGNIDTLAKTYRRLSALVDRISLCLDIGAEIYPRIGLECFIDPQPEKISRWADFIDHLISTGLCSPAKRDALLSWPGYTYPPSSRVPWPAEMMVESMLAPSDRFSIMGRRLSHIKLDLKPQQTPSAKAYFGFGRLWLQSEAPEVKDTNRPIISAPARKEPNGPTGHLDCQEIISSIQRGIDFLTGIRNPDGCWRDFFDIEGGSDEWVTAYTGSALAWLSDDSARNAARQAWTWLASRRANQEGWGYNAGLPADADSTSWGLRLAQALGQEDSPRARAAVQFLKQHRLPNGGIASYAEKYFRDFTGLSKRLSLQGWCQSHPEVTAAAAAVKGFEKGARRYLRNIQHPDGYWKAYWDCDVEYATALAAEALARGRHPDNLKDVQRAVQWAAGRFDATGSVISKALSRPSAYASAGCIRIIALAKNKGVLHKLLIAAIDSLIKGQQQNGAWLPSVKMRQPPPFVLDPDKELEGTVVALDCQSVFTTATVLTALESIRRLTDCFYNHKPVYFLSRPQK